MLEAQVPYGDYQERPVMDADGNPVFVTVEPGEEGKYIRYKADGSIEVQEERHVRVQSHHEHTQG